METIYWGQGGDGGQGETKKMSFETENKILQRDNKRLRDALAKIADPIEYLKREARKEGAQLNGAMAVALSNDVSWLKNIAKQALEGGGE